METPKIPRQVKSRMLKDRILKVTSQLMRENGFEFVTVSNVCKAAGVSTGSFYHHFANKDELLAYFLIAAFEEHTQEFSSFATDDVIKNVVHCYHLYDDFLLEQGIDFIKNYYTTQNKGLDVRANRQKDSKLGAPIMQKTIELMTEAVHTGDMLSTINATELGEDLCILEKGIIFDWCLCDGEFDLKNQTEHMMKNYLHIFLTQQYFEKYPDTYPPK